MMKFSLVCELICAVSTFMFHITVVLFFVIILFSSLLMRRIGKIVTVNKLFSLYNKYSFVQFSLKFNHIFDIFKTQKNIHKDLRLQIFAILINLWFKNYLCPICCESTIMNNNYTNTNKNKIWNSVFYSVS